MISAADKSGVGVIAQITGIVLLIIGASGVFSEIQSGLNTIWGVKAKSDRKWFSVLKARFLSFSMVLGIAFLLFLSMLISILLTVLMGYLSQWFGGEVYIGLILNYFVSFFITTMLFAMMFKILPDVYIYWSEVWLSAFVTALLFSMGKFLVAIYLNHSNIISAYGAASSLIIILMWVYFVAQIFFIGAEITKILALKKGKKIIAVRGATRIYGHST
jgi:membrane protein